MILTLITHDRGVVEETCLQAVTLGRLLAEELGLALHAVWIGASPDTASLAEHGVTTVHHVTHSGLDDYCPGAWGKAFAQLVESVRPEAVLAIGSERGNEVMAHLGAITGLPMVANAREVTVGDVWNLMRTRWGGSLVEETSLEAATKLVTVAEHAIESVGAGKPADIGIVSYEPELTDADFATKVVDRVETSDGITLATAPVVVSGGRGVGSADGFGPLEELASLLGGVVGCSRVVTNSGWRPHSDQVGQTGTVIAPDLYIACGISGAIQHWVGMMAAKTILAINTDAEAPMVTKADYAVIADLGQMVPAIVAEIRSRRSG